MFCLLHPWKDHLDSMILGFLIIFTNLKGYNEVFCRKQYLQDPLQCRFMSCMWETITTAPGEELPRNDWCWLTLHYTLAQPPHRLLASHLTWVVGVGCKAHQMLGDCLFLQVQMQPTDFSLPCLCGGEASFIVCLNPIWCLKNDFHHHKLPGCRWVNSSPVPISPLS